MLWLQVQSARCAAIGANSADATETANRLVLIRDECLEWSPCWAGRTALSPSVCEEDVNWHPEEGVYLLSTPKLRHCTGLCIAVAKGLRGGALWP